MTAYLSRLFHGPGPSTGIRKRPRSRYEPDPDTYLSHDPIQVGSEPQEEQRPADAAASSHTRRHDAVEHAARADVDGDSPSGQSLSRPARPTGESVAAELITRSAPRDQHDADRLANRDNPDDTAPASREQASDPSTPADALLRRPSISDDAAPYVASGDDGPATTEEAGDEQSVHVQHQLRHAQRHSTPPASQPSARAAARPRSEPFTDLARPVFSPPPSAAVPITADAGNAHPSATPEPNRGTRLPAPAAKFPDPLLRQAIVDAIAEPAAAQNNEVVVHIDRIDVHAHTGTAPSPPEPRQVRAAPTSLESYLRSRSRRGAR